MAITTLLLLTLLWGHPITFCSLYLLGSTNRKHISGVPLTCMLSWMSDEWTRDCKCFPTCVTDIRLLSSVSPHMIGQCARLSKSLSTPVADIWLLPTVLSKSEEAGCILSVHHPLLRATASLTNLNESGWGNASFTHLAWIFRLLDVANCKLQASHLYGFSSPWCIRLWKTSWHFWAKPLSHSSHLYGFSPKARIKLTTLTSPCEGWYFSPN